MPPYDPTLSDGCTMAPDLSPAVYACCLAHDAVWAVAGSWLAFLASNLDLGACIAATEWAIAAVPYALATTVCGWPIWWWRRRQARRLHRDTQHPPATT